MGKKGFDLAALARESMSGLVSNLDTIETVEEIPCERIDANTANFYAMSDLEELAASIVLTGLLHPIIVKAGEDGRYTILDGERRFRALGILGRDTVPAIVRKPVNAILEELMLIEANRTQRKLSDADLSRQAERYTELLRQLRDSGVEIPGRLRDRVAEAMQVSAAKLGRLQAIRENASPAVLTAFDAGEINESVAYELQRLEPELQDEIIYAEVGGHEIKSELTAEKVGRIAAGLQQKKANRCDTAAAKSVTYSAEAYLQQRAAEDDDFFELLTEEADVFLRALSAVNSRAEGIETLKREFRTSGYFSSELESDRSARGLTLSSPDRKIKRISRTWTEVYDMLCTIALNRAVTSPAPVSNSDTAPTGPEWHRMSEKCMPPRGSSVICWGDGGLYKPVPSMIEEEFKYMPERCRWWAIIVPPKEERT